MKTFRFFGMALVAVLVCAGFASCSSDDDDDAPAFDVPAYESVSAKYVATSSAAEFVSVELTASGNYIIVPNQSGVGYAGAASVGEYPAFMSGVTVLSGMSSYDTRAVYTGIIYGTYTQNGDNEFVLNGFGKITVQEDGDGAVSLTIQKNGGSTYVMTAAKQTQHPDSNKTNSLCRTWNVETVGMTFSIGGKVFFEETVDKENFTDLFRHFLQRMEELESQYDDEDDDEYYEDDKDYDDDEIDDEYIEELAALVDKPEEVVFTKAGTYMVYYKGGELAVSTWAWENESKGILRYSWNYEDMYDRYLSGEVTVSFKGGNLYLTSSSDLTDDEDDYEDEDMPVEMTFTWGFSEKK